MTPLGERLQAAAATLVADAVDALYRDPFWMDRFGEPGVRLAREDGARHVERLVHALEAGEPETLVSYARSLQAEYSGRGMCTLHLDESFAALGASILVRGLDDRGRAAQHLAAARAGLRSLGAGGAMQECAAALAAAAAADQPDPRRREAETLASFVADAVALGAATQLIAYVDWLRGLHQRTGVEAAALPAMIRRMRDAALSQSRAPEVERTFAADALAAALSRLEAR